MVVAVKILLIGFSKQSAEALRMLINREFADWECEILERSFCDNLYLCLPTLELQHQDANAMVINLDGVGMTVYQADHIQRLRSFIGMRATALVSRGQTTLWQNSQILPAGLLFCIQSPFQKNDILAVLSNLIKVAPKDTQNTPIDSTLIAKTALEKSPEKTISSHQTTKQSLSLGGFEYNFLRQLLNDFFVIKQSRLLYELLDVSLMQSSFNLYISSQNIYINPKQNLALVHNLPRVMHYCEVVKRFETLTDMIKIVPISEHEFLRQSALSPKNGYQKYAFNTLLWQMYAEILPDDIVIKNDNLSLKMRYMPNFANMNDVPEYVRSLIASCLKSPKNLKQLKHGLEGLGQENASAFNRVFLLAILSGAADIDELKRSVDNPNAIQQQAKNNQSVQTAVKSGFLGRLLGKLRF